MTFSEGKARARAVGVWAMVAACGSALGVLLGGLLADWLSWRWVLYVNVPIVAVGLLLAWVSVHDRRTTRVRRPSRARRGTPERTPSPSARERPTARRPPPDGRTPAERPPRPFGRGPDTGIEGCDQRAELMRTTSSVRAPLPPPAARSRDRGGDGGSWPTVVKGIGQGRLGTDQAGRPPGSPGSCPAAGSRLGEAGLTACGSPRAVPPASGEPSRVGRSRCSRWVFRGRAAAR